MTTPTLPDRILALLLAEPPHRWRAASEMARDLSADVPTVEDELVKLRRAGLVSSMLGAWQATERVRTHARQTAAIEARQAACAASEADTRPGVAVAMRRALTGRKQATDGRIIYRCPNGHALNGPDSLNMGCIADRCAGTTPVPPSPSDTARRAQLRADVLAWLAVAPLDEQELLFDIALRIKRGRAQYGAWSAVDEQRDLVQEEHEEHLDGLVYSSMRRVRARIVGGGA